MKLWMSRVKRFQVCLDDVMIFTTGVPSELPLGFSLKPSIKFCDGQFPRANTCVLAYRVKINFTCSMCFAILNVGGYGKFYNHLNFHVPVCILYIQLRAK